MNFELLEKPILLVGNCSQGWIDDHAAQINAKVAKYAFGCVYQGPRTFSFKIPFETSDNSYRFDESKPAQESDLPKVTNKPLDTITSEFAKRFSTWNIVLPEEAVANRRRGKICQEGWAIWFLFGSDEIGEYLDFYAAHRMTNDHHLRLYEDGQSLSLPAIPVGRSWSEDPEKDAQLEKEYREEARQIDELLAAKGFGIDGDEPGGVQIQRYQRLQ